jgi:hypothetical protein
MSADWHHCLITYQSRLPDSISFTYREHVIIGSKSQVSSSACCHLLSRRPDEPTLMRDLVEMIWTDWRRSPPLYSHRRTAAHYPYNVVSLIMIRVRVGADCVYSCAQQNKHHHDDSCPSHGLLVLLVGPYLFCLDSPLRHK